MPGLMILSDVETDQVSGGGLIVIAAHSGGTGEIAFVGGRVQPGSGIVVVSNVNVSIRIKHGTASVTGVDNVRIHL